VLHVTDSGAVSVTANRLLAVVGLFVGVAPVALGMLWFPFVRWLSDRALHAVLVTL